MKSRQQLKERVLKDQDITEIIEKMAGGNGRRLIQLRKKAGEYFDEIAADYNIAYIEFFNTVLTWLWKRIFQGIDVDPAELAVVREWAGKGPVIYIPSHKSHIDYLIFTYVLYQHHMHNPRIAAGKNLAFWPMGHIFRKCGAFFIRRTLKGARLYSKVFAGYVKALLQEGYPIEFFIEGGRSRSGKLIIPKIGFLSILLEAYRTGCCNDLVFVPASISYDRVIEEEAYIKELEGGEKVKESPKGLFGARHFLKKKYGKIYIRFGEIFSLNEFLAQRGDLEAGLHRDLAFHLIRSINKVTMVTPLALVALAILTAHRRGFHVQELTSTVEALLSFLERYEVPTATSLNNFQKTVEETLLLLTNRKVVNFLEDVDGAETFYYVDDEKKRELEYYKNSIIHYFICHAFVAVSLLTATDERKTEESILSDYGFLKRLFRKEFVYDEEKDAREEIDRVTTYFSDASLLTRSDTDGGYKLTRPGYNTLPIWAALTKTFLESYWIATRSFIQRKDKPRKSGDLLKNMNYLGLRFHKLGLIDHMEAVSQVTFKNAIPVIEEYISEGQDKSEEDGRDAWERLSRLSQRLYDFSHYRRIR
jgi:glycerol-3-phosphate O-acyltransferase